MLDVSQVSNIDLLGSKYLSHQENYMVEAFLGNLHEAEYQKHKDELLFDYREMKCTCKGPVGEAVREEGCSLSIGETFI